MLYPITGDTKRHTHRFLTTDLAAVGTVRGTSTGQNAAETQSTTGHVYRDAPQRRSTRTANVVEKGSPPSYSVSVRTLSMLLLSRQLVGLFLSRVQRSSKRIMHLGKWRTWTQEKGRGSYLWFSERLNIYLINILTDTPVMCSKCSFILSTRLLLRMESICWQHANRYPQCFATFTICDPGVQQRLYKVVDSELIYIQRVNKYFSFIYVSLLTLIKLNI